MLFLAMSPGLARRVLGFAERWHDRKNTLLANLG